MDEPTLVIGGMPTSFASAWVHLKPRPHEPVRYEVSIPHSLWQEIFDPMGRRPEALSWVPFIWSEVEQLSTFIVAAWLKAMSAAILAVPARWEWVIATVDGVSEHEDRIRLTGEAERFEPWRFASRSAD